jgi:hypothetical protein
MEEYISNWQSISEIHTRLNRELQKRVEIIEKYESSVGLEKGGYGMLVRSLTVNIAKLFQEYEECLAKTKSVFVR